MSIINRYIFKTIFFAILLVLLIICALSMLAKIIDQLDSLTESFNFIEILLHSVLLLPVNIYSYIPFAVLVGSLIGLGSLASSSELVSIRAAGVSLLQITIAVIKPVLVFILVALFLAEYIVPVSEQYADNRRLEKLGKTNSALSSKSGVWNRENNEFMHFNSVQANGRLQGVTRYQFDEDDKLTASSFSSSAIYLDGYWLEEHIVETQISGGQTQTMSYPVRQWRNQLSPELLAILVQDSENLALSRLYHYISYLEQQNIDSARYQLSFWNKVLQPAAIISLVMIALSFVFGSLREVTMGYRIFTGVTVGIVFQMSQRLLGPTSLVYEFPPVIAVSIPIFACLFIGLYLLLKKH